METAYGYFMFYIIKIKVCLLSSLLRHWLSDVLKNHMIGWIIRKYLDKNKVEKPCIPTMV